MTTQKQERPVVIVGGGFSGTLLAVNLLRQGASVVLVERDGKALARGLAYGACDADHLLNVRAANMSAFPDDSSHFLRWLGNSEADKANRFVSRQTYGLYLNNLFEKAREEAGGRFTLITQEAVTVADDGVVLADGTLLKAGAVVLALGHFPPQPLPQLAGLPSPLLMLNPWSGDAAKGQPADGRVLLIGTGLTAVDVTLSLDKAGFGGQIVALSRRGLQPRAHLPVGPQVTPAARPELRGSALLRHVRQRAAQVGWHHAVDELRPHTQHLWRQHNTVEQGRFLRHLRPWWDVHRHRIAPEIAQRLAALQAKGRLDYVAARLVDAKRDAGGVLVTWRRRGTDRLESGHFARIILCTGPESDLTRNSTPLLADLLGQGKARPDPHHLGLDADHQGRLRDASGAAQPHLYAIGPLTKGEAWEIIAVPDIRRQVWDLARLLTDAHWVGGEGL